MKWTDLVLRLRALRSRSSVEEELDEELKFHLEMESRKHSMAGLNPGDAERKATRNFGRAGYIREECRDVRGTRSIEDFLHDLRFGFRVLRKDRGYAVASIAALAVGIGVNAALFTLFTAVGLKPLPVPDPASLVSLWRVTPDTQPWGRLSLGDYVYIRDHNASFTRVAAEEPRGFRLSDPSSGGLGSTVSEPVSGLLVTANYFETFGVRPVAGRFFSSDEDLLTGEPFPALLSENFWRRRFGGDPSVLGRTFMLSRIKATVVGITPRDFMGTRPEVPDIWITMSALGDPQRLIQEHADLCCNLTAHLKPGTTLRQAQAEVSLVPAALAREYPRAERRWTINTTPATRFGPNHANAQRMFIVLQCATALVLLIACTNVAGLLLGRAAARQREMAVRLSVGATRFRLIRQLVTEALLISVLAGSAALLVSWQAMAAIIRAASTAFASRGGTIAIDVTPDMRVFWYLFSVSILAGISFAMAPALRSTRPDLASALKEHNADFGLGPKGRFRGLMVAGQIGVCLALLMGAGLLVSNFLRLLSLDTGFATRSVLAMTISNPRDIGYTTAHRRDLETHLSNRLQGIPGIVSVALASRIPIEGSAPTTRVVPAGSKELVSGQQEFPYTYVSPNYFETLGIPLLRGRGFTIEETTHRASVAVVSDALARRLWPNEDPVGKWIDMGSLAEENLSGDRAPLPRALEIVGIARDVYSVTLMGPDRGAVYIPKPLDDWYGFVLLRIAGDQNMISAAMIREFRAIEPGLSVNLDSLHHIIATGEGSKAFRVGAVVLAGIGLVGLVLALVGVYSMAAYSVSQQTSEIGIRMALGAQRADVLRLVLSEGLRWIVLGLVLGTGLGVILSRALASQLLLENHNVVDPATILVACGLTAAFALVAAYFPARRATRLDPSVTLRFE